MTYTNGAIYYKGCGDVSELIYIFVDPLPPNIGGAVRGRLHERRSDRAAMNVAGHIQMPKRWLLAPHCSFARCDFAAVNTRIRYLYNI